MISYKTYMKNTYLNEDSIYGDLAKDINNDSKFPNYILFDKIDTYLESMKACKEAMTIFCETYIDYLNKHSTHHYSQLERNVIIENVRKMQEYYKED